MSSDIIFQQLDDNFQTQLHELIAAKDVAVIRQFLSNFDVSDVDRLLIEKGLIPAPSPVQMPPRPSGSKAKIPVGAEDVQSMFSGSFVNVAKPDDGGVGKPPAREDVSESELTSMWGKIDDWDVSVLDPGVVEAFKYQGFNPDAILKTLLLAKKAARLDDATFLKDITVLCALAVIKGSVTNKNITKMSDKGKAHYDVLEKRYHITRGGAKGKPAEVVTVARIAAAFPGKVIQLLQTKKVPGRDFVSDLQTHKLPGVVKHQALAACVPKDLADRSKMFLLDLVTAFSTDQTKTISNSKETSLDIIEKQKQFTNVSHSGPYPPEKMRKVIIKGFTWSEIFPNIAPVATHIKGKWNDFHLVTQQEFMEDLNKL